MIKTLLQNIKKIMCSVKCCFKSECMIDNNNENDNNNNNNNNNNKNNNNNLPFTIGYNKDNVVEGLCNKYTWV